MKKYLLLLISIFIVISVFAQKDSDERKVYRQNSQFEYLPLEESFDGQIVPKKVELNGEKNGTITRYEMGKSANVYTLLKSLQRCMFYDEASNSILGTFRADPATYPEALGSGTVMSFYSSNMGENWDWQITLNPDPNIHALRYPNGVVFNPAESSNIEDAFVVVAGPSHMGGTWDYTYFGSAQLNNSNFSNSYLDWEGENDWARSCMTVVPNAVYHFGHDYVSVGNHGVNQKMKQFVGTSNNPSNGFNWIVNEVSPDWKEHDTEGYSFALYNTWSAWSKDGSVGYMWIVGITNDSYDYGVYQPQIYYTINGGDSWNYIELNIEDHPVLANYLSQSSMGTVRASFLTDDKEYPGVVDYNGKLHLFSNVFASADGTPISGTLVEGDAVGGIIFDFIIGANGIEDVKYVSDLNSLKAADHEFGDVDWAHRLQASKSTDEKVVFAVWTDDPDSDDGTLKNPDIYAWALNSETNVNTDAIDFTSNTLYGGYYFFPFVSELTPLVDGTYKIPVSTSITPSEYGGNDPLAPVTHSYVDGIEFDASIFGSLTTQILVNPAEQSVNTSEVFTTTIEIEDVENLGSFELEVDFNPSYLQLNSVEEGDFLTSSGRTAFPLVNTIDNSNGLLEYAITTLGSNPPGPNGNGVLLELEWTATDDLADDVSTSILLQDIQVTEPNGSVINSGSQNGIVNILACYQHDFDCDCDVDIVDVTMAAYAYGTSVGNPNYSATFDLDNDGDVDIVDITMVTYDYGWSCGKSGSSKMNLEEATNDHVELIQNAKHLGNGIYEVSLDLEKYEQLGGYEIGLQYNQNQQLLLSHQVLDMLSESGRQSFELVQNIDEDNGLIQVARTTHGSSIEGVFGSNGIVSFQFKSLNGQKPVLNLINAQFVRIDAEIIPFKYSIPSIVEKESRILNVSPNPVNEHFKIEYQLTNQGSADLKIFNAFGQIVFQKEIANPNEGMNELEISHLNLNSGAYIITLESNKCVVDTFRVIVK